MRTTPFGASPIRLRAAPFCFARRDAQSMTQPRVAKQSRAALRDPLPPLPTRPHNGRGEPGLIDVRSGDTDQPNFNLRWWRASIIVTDIGSSGFRRRSSLLKRGARPSPLSCSGSGVDPPACKKTDRQFLDKAAVVLYSFLRRRPERESRASRSIEAVPQACFLGSGWFGFGFDLEGFGLRRPARRRRPFAPGAPLDASGPSPSPGTEIRLGRQPAPVARHYR